MTAFDRYIFRTTFGAFLLVLISLTAVIWLTHALREIDLMTNQRQTILTFIGITGLLIPMLVLVIAPLALVVAVGHTLNRLNTDSEIVVMNASGMSPWRIFRPFLTTTLVVSVLVLGVSAYVAPAGLARVARLGHQGEGAISSSTSSSPAASCRSSAASRSISASGAPTDNCSASSSTIAATRTNGSPRFPSMARSSRRDAGRS